MAFQSVWYYTDLPEDIVDIIERDVSEKFDEQMGDSKLMEMLSTKRNVTHKMPGFLPRTGLVVSCGTISNAQTVRTSCMICGVLMENRCNTPDMVKVSSTDGIMMLV